MSEILFLCHRVPFPPDRGDKIRSHHLLKGLAKLAPVHVGTFAETDQDRAQDAALRDLAASHLLIDRDTSLPKAGLRALASGKPVSLPAFADARLSRWVAQTLAQHDIDTIVIFSGQMGQYIPDGFAGRVVVDLCDVDSAKFAGYAREAGFPRSWLMAREARLLAREEARIARRADCTLLISNNELALFQSRLPVGNAYDVRALGNGIDGDFFDPAATAPHAGLAGMPGAHFVFTGQMDYSPNIAAVKRFARVILPRLRETMEAQFHIVGRAPTGDVTRLGDEPGVTVWGEVPDVRPFLAAASAVVAPLMLARGVQNKVLEAMAMARPVLLSPEAATGIDAVDGEHFSICRDDAAFVAAARALAADPEHAAEMGRAARGLVMAQMSWEAVEAQLAAIVGRGQGGARHAA
ncbi:glycosyl transferase family 1 [Erythrobacter sp. QSSC1-22B]|uniref:TIGR03087 family PEP-CTERM/XrtA system glycosyltransferase n=1 Tax=Erythrobacter sp. QSSC1-22B TaxID=1860125 RepID=UPI0008059142|nr:TIGR03087 family PEP-CTERM/XrtA system glycosyltransferase [Erythrobacter sp. QSSC1-22B]OBX20353.1 glycosyl transferase family 1 [Erythrobacter sp. QSSC1-22B]